MNPTTLGEIKGEARDLFSYILLGCPDFPATTGSTTAKEFEILISLVEATVERTKHDQGKQCLRICLQEIRQSQKNYEGGRLHEGAHAIQEAREHFNNAFSKKPIAARFVVGESGAALDGGRGFPS